MIGLILAVALSQTPAPDPVLPVTLSSGLALMKQSQAERLLKTTDDAKLKAAIEIALITQPTRVVEVQLPYSDFHRERWQRQPLQCGGGAGFNNTVACSKD